MNNVTNQLNNLIGTRVKYKSRHFNINAWAIIDGQIQFQTDSETININRSDLNKELDKMKVVGKTAIRKHRDTRAEVMNPNNLNPVDDILMDTIKKVQDSQEYVSQAKAINQSVSNLINAQKVKIEMMKQSHKMSTNRENK